MPYQHYKLDNAEAFFGSKEALENFRKKTFEHWATFSVEEAEREIPHFFDIFREQFPEKFIGYDEKKEAEKLQKECEKEVQKLAEKNKNLNPFQLSLFD